MKDLGIAKKIFEIRISRDKHKGTLQLSHEEYDHKVLERYIMTNAKPISSLLAIHFKLTKRQCPIKTEEKDFMTKVPYASAIAHAVGVVSIYMSNPSKQHWKTIKWTIRYLQGYYI